MEPEIPTFSIGISLVSLIFLTLVGFAYDAHAVTVITVRDEASCVALPLSAGTAEWDDSGNRCHISEEAILEINDEETLDLQVHLSSAGTISNFGIVDIGAHGSLSIHQGQLTNHGTINIRAGGSLGIADAIFHNVPNAIVNNHGFFLGSSDNPRITNEGTVNNLDTGRMDATHDEGKFFNKAQGVINNHGLMRNVDQSGFVNDGKLNNYGSFNFANFLERTEASPQQGIINNFGDISLAGEFHNVATIVNYARFNINGGFTLEDQEGILFNDGTIDNRADGVIESFGEFMNPGVIKNQGKISLYCSGFFHNTGSFTGNPINNACEGIPPEITAPADVTFSSSQNRLDLCQNMPITRISAIGDDGAGNVAANTLDNNLSTRWSRGGGGAWIKPDLGSTKVICSVDIAWYKGDQRSYFFDISVSNNGVNFKKVFTGESSGSTSSFERYEFADSVGRYVKITLSSGISITHFASITEIDINGYTSLGMPLFSDNMDPSPLVQNSVPASGFPVGTMTVTWTATDLNGNRNSDTQVVKVIAGDSALPMVSISSPTTGSTITGSPNGVKVNLKGSAADTASGVQKVEIKSLKSGVGVHAYQQVTPGAPGNWGTWSHALTFTQTGTYTITARATDKAGNQNWHSITVRIAFQSDTTDPTVSVTSPQNGASFSGPASVPKKISLTGIAADSGSGIQKVELKSLKDGAVVHAYQLASTSNNWSSWGKTLSFAQGGTYTITARVTDNAGNQNWHSLTVNISLR